MIWRRSLRTPVLTAAALLFLLVCVLPVASIVWGAVTQGIGQSNVFETVLLDARQRSLLTNSALLAGGTAILATVIGAPLGVALSRVPLGQKPALRVALAAPVTLPPYIVALAWIYLGGSWIYSLPGAVIVLSLVFYPLSMLATEAAMRHVDGRLEEAALLIAPPGRVLRRITAPLVAPAVLAAGLVIFVLALSEFGVPGLLRVRVYPTEVFTAFAALYDVGRATLLMLPLLLLSTTIAVMAGVIGGDRFVVARRVTGAAPLLLPAFRRPVIASVVGVIFVALVLPVAVLAREASGTRLLSTVIASGEAIVNSLVLSTVGASAVIGLAIWVGYARARARPSVGRAVDVLLVVLFAVPGTVVGVGLIGFWNRPGPLGALYGTDAMTLLAYLARLVPVAVLTIAAAIRSVPVSHEEAGAVSGAGWLRTLRHLVLPQTTIALAAAWVVAFILAFGELGAAILVAPPGEATLPIRIYTMIANAPPSQVAALALLQASIVGAPLALLGLAASRSRR
ncbi:MAG: ABC transporter permease [Vicinamibacterales bacterium]